MDTSGISSAFTIINGLITTGKAAFEVRDELKLNEAKNKFLGEVIQLQDWILASQKDKALLLEEIATLKEEVAQQSKRNAYGDNYERTDVGSNNFAYVDKNFTGSFSSAHKYCANCFEAGTYSTLEQTYHTFQVDKPFHTMRCNTCNQKLTVFVFGSAKST